MGQLIWRNSTI